MYEYMNMRKPTLSIFRESERGETPKINIGPIEFNKSDFFIN
jgi:hypothetical protein